MAVGRSDYEERKERRISRYEDRALRANAEAEAFFEKAHDMASAIPFGQPVLVGHHSEGADRSYRKRVENTQRKSFEAAEKAAYYQDKAETAAANNAISGDNPDAVNLYREKLAKLEAAQEEMKAVNKAFAKGDDALKALGFTDEQIAKMKNNIPSYERKPYPSWALSNNNAEIRRVKEKIEQLEKMDTVESETIIFKGGKLLVNAESNRVQFLFPGKPSDEIRSLLKSYGFRWAPSEGAWQRQRTLNAIRTAKHLVSKIEAGEEI
jgi:chemotaxis protein histidine kinase CheA